MPSIDPLDIAKEIEAAITCYVIAILSDKSDHTQKSRELAQEILTHLTAWERQSKLFDECEVELEAKNDEEE